MGKVISFLWVLTPISSTISVIIVWVAMATSDWIRTQERILNSQYNGSADNKYILKMTYSGIWEICTVTGKCLICEMKIPFWALMSVIFFIKVLVI